MLGVLFIAIILSGSLWVIARHDADFNFWKILLISFVYSIASNLAIATIGLLGIPLALAGLIWAIVRWCYVSILQAVIVSGILLVVQILIAVLLLSA